MTQELKFGKKSFPVILPACLQEQAENFLKIQEKNGLIEYTVENSLNASFTVYYCDSKTKKAIIDYNESLIKELNARKKLEKEKDKNMSYPKFIKEILDL